MVNTPTKRQGIPIALAVLGLIMVIAGLLFATVLRPDPTVTAQAERPDTPYETTVAGLLGLVDTKVTVHAEAPGQPIVLALGRDADAHAWIGELPNTQLTGLSSWKAIASTKHNGEMPEADPEEFLADQFDKTLAQSDMWLDVKTGKNSLSWDITTDGSGVVLLAATNGVDPAPKISLTWQRDTSSAWIIALTVIGIILLLLGLVPYLALQRRRKEDARSEETRVRRRHTLQKFSGLKSPFGKDATSKSEQVSEKGEDAASDTQKSAKEEARQQRVSMLERQARPATEERTEITTTIGGKTHVLPSRRAMREARARGEAEVSLGGQTFATGLIPVIPRPDDAEAEKKGEGK
ncbi:hypothetical protein HMPREF9238_00494 [Gleimia europaea ACS-120-V-Col10b]|uniref:Uncharacterized protein n=1 Tax=Gleimia europaea ACS-120-V-Col10b TaxID=883069 RepID=A0A9W5VWC9_9ACTO|nr:hypothetical protein HMPREF9238_00494 [Gleimia europaea ACS-120-V-Col10b]